MCDQALGGVSSVLHPKGPMSKLFSQRHAAGDNNHEGVGLTDLKSRCEDRNSQYQRLLLKQPQTLKALEQQQVAVANTLLHNVREVRPRALLQPAIQLLRGGVGV